MIRRNLHIGVVVTAFIALGISAVPAHAGEVITVCATECDFLTIQEAIDHPGIVAGAVIEVRDAVHTEGAIQVSKNVTLSGLGADKTVVQAHTDLEGSNQRVFLVQAGTAAVIHGMMIRYGNPQEEPQGGGGIRNEGELRVEECIISYNQASSGGGLYNTGTLTLVDSLVSNNSTFGGSSIMECNNGGGIKALAGAVTLINTTVSGNKALGKGAGMHIACKATLVMQNSTISGNNTTFDGGGIYLDGVAEITNSTIVMNSAHNGGGIYADGTPEEDFKLGFLNYTATVIADNIISFAEYGVADCKIGDHASIGVNAGNFVGDGSCEASFSGDARLGPLADNGGLTQTHAPLAGSPLVDALPRDQCLLETDQRGQTRPSGKACDIGALELLQHKNPLSTPWLVAGGVALLLGFGLAIAMGLRKKG
ncbi:MAG: hypothetical protein JW726_02600 [Anaerolineales bacterium]|nr:hypothetical protein [Anaerolineales bacterium]